MIHDSVGSQKTAISNINLRLLSKAVKYDYFKDISTQGQINKYFTTIKKKTLHIF